jgi:hypothetical protein
MRNIFWYEGSTLLAHPTSSPSIDISSYEQLKQAHVRYVIKFFVQRQLLFSINRTTDQLFAPTGHSSPSSVDCLSAKYLQLIKKNSMNGHCQFFF